MGIRQRRVKTAGGELDTAVPQLRNAAKRFGVPSPARLSYAHED